MRIVTRNADNVVVMYSDGGKPEAAADQTAHDLTEAQAEACRAVLAQPNGGVTFDGTIFTALPEPPPPPPPTPEQRLAAAGLTVADLKALLGLA